MFALILRVVGLGGGTTQARGPGSAAAKVEEWDVTQRRGQTRTVDFTTTEDTWMSVDGSPDRKWIVFDLFA